MPDEASVPRSSDPSCRGCNPRCIRRDERPAADFPRPASEIAPIPFPAAGSEYLGVRRRLPRLSLVALTAVAGPGLLAGLSDDDPAGITTYSILGTDYGYSLLWVLALSTGALIAFHELGARMGVVTGKGLMTLVRERFGGRRTVLALGALVIANVGTTSPRAVARQSGWARIPESTYAAKIADTARSRCSSRWKLSCKTSHETSTAARGTLM